MRKTCCERCAADRSHTSLAYLLIVVAVVASISCTSRTAAKSGARATPAPKVSFFNEGKLLVIGVDVRAARLAGPSEFLPLQILVENHGKRPLRLERERIVLERPDGTRLPVCTVREFRGSYQRGMADAHLGSAFLETISGRFPEPPFHWQAIDFFPLRTDNTVPRDAIDIRLGDVVFGYIYFRQPNLEPPGVKGVYKLLVRLDDSDATYLVDLIPYDLH